MSAHNHTAVGVLGVGYVGLVTAACFADLGHRVVCRDINPDRIESLRNGGVPIYEPGVDRLLERNRDRLRFTLDIDDVFEQCRMVFVCVDTPPMHSGDADLSRVHRVIDELPRDGDRFILVMKSTVPVGTAAKLRAELEARGLGDVGYVSNPEFLREGSAIADFMKPDRIVIGAFDDRDGEEVAGLYADLEATVVSTDPASAEMTKYASNAFLATKISFINEIANVCEEVGADVSVVAYAMGLDERIGSHFLRPGIGYGGSCLAGEEIVTLLHGDVVEDVSLAELFGRYGGPGGNAGDLVNVQVLSWHVGREEPEFMPVSIVTARRYEDEVVDVHVVDSPATLTVTLDHPFVVRDGAATRVVEAGDLKLDDLVPQVVAAPLPRYEPLADMSGQAVRPAPIDQRVVWAPLQSLERRPFDGTVYSLEVPEAHTFVTSGGTIVHNCFPKDVQALKQLAGNSGYHFQLLTAVIEVNELQKRRVVGKLEKHLGLLRGRRIALLGLAFKANTDDMREASSLVLSDRLRAEGATVVAYDPVAMDAARARLNDGVELAESMVEAVRGADAAVIVTEWSEFRSLASRQVREAMASPLIVDGRNLLDPAQARAAGFVYESVGRPSAEPV